MNAVERLKRDHHILRSKFDVIEAVLPMEGDAWFVLRDICFTLARQLQNHMKREEALVMACRTTMPPHLLAEVAVEHRDEPERLRAINPLFLDERSRALERIRPALLETIRGLRRHMAQEEAELFPALERMLSARAVAPSEAASGRGLQECMTVNRVVREHPETRAVFDRLFINLPLEGCACLDEVAWRHGVESEELLARLEQAVLPGRPPVRDKGATSKRVVCGCR